MRANTVTLLGSVVISQGQNVVRGDRLTVDMTSGVSRGRMRQDGRHLPGSGTEFSRAPGSRNYTVSSRLRARFPDAKRRGSAERNPRDSIEVSQCAVEWSGLSDYHARAEALF
jgi:hypothetical protein